MRKRVAIVLLMMGLTAGTAMAAQRGTQEYEKLKEYKRKQAEERQQKKTDPASKEKGFWQREAERSGLAGTGAMFANAISSALPLDKPNSRKKAETP